MKVFVSGSISIKHLPDAARQKLDSIISRGYEILVGDAGGVDFAVQQYLAACHYSRVAVYYAGNRLRHCVHPWPTRGIAADSAVRGRELFTLKDMAMAQNADYGLMIWDGKSPGTLKNMREMENLGKRFVVICRGEILSRQEVSTQLHPPAMARELALFN